MYCSKQSMETKREFIKQKQYNQKKKYRVWNFKNTMLKKGRRKRKRKKTKNKVTKIIKKI